MKNILLILTTLLIAGNAENFEAYDTVNTDELVERKHSVSKLEREIKKYDHEIESYNKKEKEYEIELEKKKLLVKKLNDKANDKVQKLKDEWNDKKNILCELKPGVDKNDIQANLNVKLQAIECESVIEGGGRTGTIIGYSYSNKSNNHYYSINVDKRYTYKTCPHKIISGDWDKECIYFNFLDNLLSDIGGCK